MQNFLMLSLKDQALIFSAGISLVVAIIALILSSIAAVRTKNCGIDIAV